VVGFGFSAVPLIRELEATRTALVRSWMKAGRGSGRLAALNLDPRRAAVIESLRNPSEYEMGYSH
jgi:hypothetical protein